MISDDLQVRTNVHIEVVDVRTGQTETIETKNVTCVAGHEAVAEFLAGRDGDIPVELALGLDGGSGTSVSDRSLNDEDARVDITTRSRTGTTTTLRAFVPSLLQIGTSTNTVDELGIVLENGDLLNHATISGRDLSGTDTLLNVSVDIAIGDS